jgi:hypothetical protein
MKMRMLNTPPDYVEIWFWNFKVGSRNRGLASDTVVAAWTSATAALLYFF